MIIIIIIIIIIILLSSLSSSLSLLLLLSMSPYGVSTPHGVKHVSSQIYKLPDSEVHGANMRPIWGRQNPGGPHVGPMKFATGAGFVQIETGTT